MATTFVCPRCKGPLQPNVRACPRCGLVLSAAPSAITDADPYGANLQPNRNGGYSQPGTVAETREAAYAPSSLEGGTAPYPPSGKPRLRRANHAQGGGFPEGTAMAAATPIVPRGAIELLSQESVAFQLGALYLTNKRVILLAPSVVRAAFLRDLDAVGTVTERASGWSLFSGIALFALAAVAFYADKARSDFETTYPMLYIINPSIIAAGLAILGLALLLLYFFWVKRSLFLSVKGRPLITVSVSGWNSRKLEGMDAFLNAFFQMKDALYDSDTP